MTRLGLALLISVIALAAWSACASQSASALEFDAGSTPGVPDGTVVDDDLYIMGGTISIDGEVSRDVFVMGGTIEIPGTVGGSVHVLGGTVNITGSVGGSVRVASGTVVVGGDVGWDVIAAGGTLTLNRNAEIGNDLVVRGGSVTVNGDIGRDIRGDVGDLTLRGSVGRDVRLNLDGELRVLDGAEIGRNVRYRADREAEISDDAVVAGTVTFEERSVRNDRGFIGAFASWLRTVFLRLGWAVVAGTVLVLAMPRQASGVADRLSIQPVASLLWGVGVFIVTPVAVLFLLLTIIGLPAAIFLALAFGALLYLSQVFVGMAIGRALMPGSWRLRPNRWRLWVAMLLGVTFIVVIRLLPIPFGWTFWTSLAIGFVAMGAVWMFMTGIGVSNERRPQSVSGGGE